MLIQSFLSIAAIMMTACSATLPNQANFKTPAKVCELPPELLEVSGLTDVDGSTVACVHDESGELYLYDLENCSVKEKITFEGPGDFEGLTRVGDNQYYALRSDGAIFKIVLNGKGKPAVDKIETKIPAADNEGLGYDERNNRLLLSPKSKYADKDLGKNYRPIYAYDLGKGSMKSEPAFQVSVEEAKKVVQSNAGIQLKNSKKSGGVNFKFDIASIAAHPQKDLYYLLSSSEQFILVVDGNGKPLEALPLDSRVFENPEGITFLDENTMVVSSEGNNGPPTIGVFNL